MNAYTPGPWSIKYRTSFGGNEPYFDGVIDADGRQLRVDGVTLTSGPIAEANARLIAAAPELLAALQTMVAEHVQMVNSGDCGFWNPEDEAKVIDARAAIAKATGGAS